MYLNLLFSRYPKLELCKTEIEAAFNLLCNTYEKQGKVLTCGNGGSASDAEHIVGELMKSFRLGRDIGGIRGKLFDYLPESEAEYISENLEGALAAISLQNETAFNTAYANDVSPEMVYAQQVFGLGKKEDSLIAISTSGNSSNVLRAVQMAKTMGLHTIGMTGCSGGSLKKYCDACICVPETETYMVQELHLPVYHTICLMLEQHFFGKNEVCETIRRQK